MLRRILVPHMRYFKNCWRYRTLKMKKWSSQWTQFMQLRKEAWKKKKNSGLQRGLNPWPREEHIEHCYRTLLRSPGRNDEANSHAQSTWRLHTPTICGRFAPAQCNAGLPKKKTLQQGKINRKTIQIVLVSTMPPRLSILSCYIPVAHGRLSMTREVFTSLFTPHVFSIFGLIAFSWILCRLRTLLKSYTSACLELVCAPPTMKLRGRSVSKTSLWLTICKRSSLCCVDCPMLPW